MPREPYSYRCRDESAAYTRQHNRKNERVKPVREQPPLMFHSDDGDDLAHTVDNRRKGRDPLFLLVTFFAPLPVDRRGACEPILERPTEYLGGLWTYGEESASLEGFVCVTHDDHGLAAWLDYSPSGYTGSRQLTSTDDPSSTHAPVRGGFQVERMLGFSLRRRINQEDTYTGEVEELRANDLFE